jgi:hypothetical protein
MQLSRYKIAGIRSIHSLIHTVCLHWWLQRINIHSVTSNHAVLARNLPSVFSVAPSASQYTSQLFPQYR